MCIYIYIYTQLNINVCVCTCVHTYYFHRKKESENCISVPYRRLLIGTLFLLACPVLQCTIKIRKLMPTESDTLKIIKIECITLSSVMYSVASIIFYLKNNYQMQ